MNIIITGRHIDVSDSLKKYAEKKIKKLDKYFNQLIDAHVILYIEKLDHASEVIINGDGVQFHGREKAADLFSSIDLLFEKMERQIGRYKEKHSAHKGPDKVKMASFNFISSEGEELLLNQASNKPVDKIEAFLQMKIENMDFILFKKGIGKIDSDLDYLNKNYAVIYRNENNLKMVEIPFEKIKGDRFEDDNFVEYELKVIEESPASPNIEFIKRSNCSISKLSLNDALQEIEKSDSMFLPFFNVESQYFNVIYKKGKNYEVMVPAF